MITALCIILPTYQEGGYLNLYTSECKILWHLNMNTELHIYPLNHFFSHNSFNLSIQGIPLYHNQTFQSQLCNSETTSQLGACSTAQTNFSCTGTFPPSFCLHQQPSQLQEYLHLFLHALKQRLSWDERVLRFPHVKGA